MPVSILGEAEQLVGELSGYQIVVGSRTRAADEIAGYAVQKPDIWQVATELVQQPLRIAPSTGLLQLCARNYLALLARISSPASSSRLVVPVLAMAR